MAAYKSEAFVRESPTEAGKGRRAGSKTKQKEKSK